MAAGTFRFTHPAGRSLMTVSTAFHHRSAPIVNQLLLSMGGILLLACIGWLQGELDRLQDRTVVQIEGLAQLHLKGEYPSISVTFTPSNETCQRPARPGSMRWNSTHPVTS